MDFFSTLIETFPHVLKFDRKFSTFSDEIGLSGSIILIHLEVLTNLLIEIYENYDTI